MSATREGPFLRATGLVKHYPGVVALDHAYGAIRSGLILGLVGKNGAGKSTLIKILAGAVQPDEGELVIDGQKTTLHGPHHATALGFAFVHQELADVPMLSVAENMELGLGYPKVGGVFVNKRALRRKARSVLARLNPDIDPRAPLGSLSLAQRRLVMIGRGLAANARLLVLDEPTASLTEEEIEHLHGVLRSLAAEGVAIIYVSHRLDEIDAVTSHVAVMRDGQVVFTGLTKDISRTKLIQEITGHLEVTQEHAPVEPPNLGEELLRVENLTRHGAVEDASFSLRGGELLGIAGLVGAGRTELARLIYGADHHNSGQIFVRGKETRVHSPRDGMGAGIALLPEDRRYQGTVQTFSVRKNVTLPTLSHFRMAPGVPLPRVGKEREVTRSFVKELGIKLSNVEHPVRYLSGGNQQKVVLAKWLGSRADVLIFDEPTHGIDVEGKEDVYRLMQDLAASGKGVIFISSEFSELVRVCHRVLIMREGRLVGELAGEAITDQELVSRCYGTATEPPEGAEGHNGAHVAGATSARTGGEAVGAQAAPAPVGAEAASAPAGAEAASAPVGAEAASAPAGAEAVSTGADAAPAPAGAEAASAGAEAAPAGAEAAPAGAEAAPAGAEAAPAGAEAAPAGAEAAPASAGDEATPVPPTGA